MKLEVERIPPNISDEEQRFNVESLFNTLCRAAQIENFNRCEYDIKDNSVHIILNKRDRN
jgi:hypothetical protein